MSKDQKSVRTLLQPQEYPNRALKSKKNQEVKIERIIEIESCSTI